MPVFRKFKLQTDTNNNESQTVNNNNGNNNNNNNNKGSRRSSSSSSSSVDGGERRPSPGILKEPGSGRPSFSTQKRLSVTFDDDAARLDARDRSPIQTDSGGDGAVPKTVPKTRLEAILQHYAEEDNYEKMSAEEVADRLLTAIHKNDIPDVERIYDTSHVSINLVNSNNESGLFLAVCYGRLEIAACLLRRNADVNVADDQGNTPLHEAVQLADEEMVALLLTKGENTNVNAKNLRGETPLHVAAEYDYAKIAGKLLEHGASPNVKNKDGRPPLMSALDDGSCAVCRLILKLPPKYSVNMQLTDNEGKTMLYLAVKSPYLKDLDVIERILEKGYNFRSDTAWLQNAPFPGKFRLHPVLWKRILDESARTR